MWQFHLLLLIFLTSVFWAIADWIKPKQTWQNLRASLIVALLLVAMSYACIPPFAR